VVVASAVGGWGLKVAAGVPAVVVFRLVIYRLGFFDKEERERLVAMLARGPARFVKHLL